MTQERIDLDAIEQEWTDFVNSKKFKVNSFAFNVLPMIAELKRCYKELDVYEEIKPDLLRLHWMPIQKGYSKALDLADIVHENEEEE